MKPRNLMDMKHADVAPDGMIPVPEQRRRLAMRFWWLGHLDIIEVDGVRHYNPESYNHICRSLDLRCAPPSDGSLPFSALADRLGVSNHLLYQMARKGLFHSSYRRMEGRGLIKHARLLDVQVALLDHRPDALLVEIPDA